MLDIPKEDSQPKLDKPDPFLPPYIPNLLIGELEDQESEIQYAALVRLA